MVIDGKQTSESQRLRLLADMSSENEAPHLDALAVADGLLDAAKLCAASQAALAARLRQGGETIRALVAQVQRESAA